jgi:tetratricopeptide (TPR) repeat protein
MNWIAAIALLAWLPLVVVVFNALPPTKAVANLFVAAWLFLPNGGFGLPGLPDYTKMTATVVGVLLCMFVFDQARLFSTRFRWFDLPMVIYCLGAFVTAITNDLGAYEGVAAVVDLLVIWGFPYLIGRVYLDDADALKDLAQAIAIGGICYIPFCLFEIRFSPVFATWVYGIHGWDGLRYGGYRPRVFLATGLELGMWMANSSLISYVLWSSGTIKAIRGVPFVMLMLALVGTAVLCKATGAIGLLAFGLAIFWVARQFKWPLVIWLVLTIPPLYCVTRALNIWSGQEIVNISTATVGADRAQSFEYRLGMERRLADRALARPVFGWGRFNRSAITDAQGRMLTVPDGFWIIVLGFQGTIGLASILSLFLLPMALTLRRFPVATWRDPNVGPVVGLALMMVVTMLDFLSNALLTPIYPLVIGGLMGCKPYQVAGEHSQAEEALAVASEFIGEGRMVEASLEFHRAIELTSIAEDPGARRIQAEAFDGLGHSLQAAGQIEEAVAAFHEALVIRDEIVAESPDDDHFRDLAIARDSLSRALAESGRTSEAIDERQLALEIWEVLAANHPKEVEYRDYRVNTLNDLAWLLATDPGPSPRDPARALALAEEAVRISPDHDASWNTLGVARYRAGDWTGAIEALERSALSNPDGGTAFDHYFLAMAWCQLHREDQAGEWLERGVAWTARHRPGHPDLGRFREEAESLMEHIGTDGPSA